MSSSEPIAFPVTLAALADRLGGRVRGDLDRRVVAVRPMDEAGPRDLGVLFDRRYVRALPSASQAALLVSEHLADRVPGSIDCLIVEDARAGLCELFEGTSNWGGEWDGIHPTAVLGVGVDLAGAVSIGPYAVIGARVRVGDGARIGAHCVIGPDSTIGPDAVLHPHVVVYPRSTLGARVEVHAGARVGSDGFGYRETSAGPRKVPQVGRCVIGDDVEVGANSTIDRGALGDTVIEDGVKIDNLVQVAHNVRVGARSLLAALVGIAGSTRIGPDVWFGGQSGAIDHLDIGAGARITVASAVLRDVPAGGTMSGYPARPHREELLVRAEQRRLGRLRARVAEMEERLASLEAAARARLRQSRTMDRPGKKGSDVKDS